MLILLPRSTSRLLLPAAGLVLAAIFVGPAAWAQSLGNAPYSRLGLGEAMPGAGLLRNQGMAGTGVAAPSTEFVNELNPALAWATRNVTFDVGVSGQLKELQTATQKQRTGNATLSYFALAIPILPRWGATIGLRPLYTVDYHNINRIGIAGDPNGQAEVQTDGEGSISQVYMAHGFRVAGGLSAGFEASYAFGSVESANSTRVVAGTNVVATDDRAVLLERRRYGDFLLRGGLAYQQKVNDKVSLGAGAAVQLGRDLHTSRRRTLERRSVSQNDAVVDEPLLLSDSVRGTSRLPLLLRAGLSLTHQTNWALAADLQYQPWTEFRVDGVSQRSLADTWRLSLGGEWTPDPTSAESYFKRVTYRFGAYGGQTPWRDRAGNALSDMGLTGGFALPLGRVVSFESAVLQASFGVGQRGRTTDGALKESYLRGQIGFAFTNIWFVKRKID